VQVLQSIHEAMRHEGVEAADVELHVPADLSVSADRDLLIRALGNLLRNALRYARDAGPILISADARSRDVTIRVADSGPGIPAGELDRIFDAFYRVDTSRTRETGGVGLGLTIVKTCIESCGGSVTARNRQPNGLEISIVLSAPPHSESDQPRAL
jgi:two-component system sensor histidine kinase CpxA